MVKLAESLERADHRSIVHVDGSGQVRSPARYRVMMAAGLGGIGVASAALIALAASVFGVVGGAAAGAFVGWAGYCLWQLRTLRRGGGFMMDRRHAEAEALFRRVAAGPLLPKSYRLLGELYLGQLCSRDGRFEEALARLRAAEALQSRRRSWMPSSIAYAQVVVLVNLGRVAEARQRFARCPEETGDYLRLARWTAELHVAFAEGEHDFTGDALHDRARVALATTVATTLLALSAWAFDHIGDRDMAEHLLREAFERPTAADLEKAAPSLYAWMREHGAA
jgi:tetratricopeptide (TPR) repeat protein